jgi:hypothetical protein
LQTANKKVNGDHSSPVRLKQRLLREEIMKKTLILFVLVLGVLSIHLQAATKRVYQPATVVSVENHLTESNYVGDNPSDAPLQSTVYAYDIGIQLNCVEYVGRYLSAFDYFPSVFTPNNTIQVNRQKHVLYVSLPGSRDVKMGIASRSRGKDAPCLTNN